MSYIKIIKSELEHEQALARLMVLMDADPALESSEANELEVLALLIEQYEEVQFPIDHPDPIEAIKFRMDQQGLKNKDLIPYIGSAPKVSEVLNGTRKLSLNMIRKLSKGLGLSAEVLIREPVQLTANHNDIDWLAFPLAVMRKRGYFEGFSGSLQELKEYSAERLTAFFEQVDSGFNLKPALLRTSAHLRTNNKETDSYSLWAWQVRVLQKAREEKLTCEYKKGSVDRNWMQKLGQSSWSDQGPLLAKEYLNQNGIHLIIEPHLPKTYLDGAVCLSHSGNPVVALTLRHDKLDNFWFSLMHELAHIALHLDGNEVWYIDDLDAESCDQVEQEADALAQEALIPTESWRCLLNYEPATIRELAKSLTISPCIIAGRLRHENHDHRMFGSLFRDKVKTCFKGEFC